MAKAPTTKLAIPSSKVEIALTPGSTAAAMKSVAATAGKLYFVPTGSIKEIPGFNVRVETPDYIAHRDMIAESIRSNGFDETKPLSGYVGKDGEDNVLYITDGHTRLAAVNTLGDDMPEKLPIIVRATAPSLTELTAQLHTSNTGRPLSPFELGVVVKRLLKEEGAEKATVAKTLAVTPRYLDDVLLLVNSPKAVREAVLDGDVSSTMAIQELRKAGDTPQKAVDRITAAVSTAKAKGKKKATAKDTGPKMMKIKHSVSVGAGTDMKEIVKAVAAHVRAAIAAVPHATDPETKVADTDGTINLVIEVPAPLTEKAPAAAPKKAPAKKPATAKKPAAPEAAPVSDAKPKTKRKAAAKPAAEPVEENIAADDDLGIDGAEEVEVTSEGLDDEPALIPPAVKNGEGVGSDEEADI